MMATTDSNGLCVSNTPPNSAPEEELPLVASVTVHWLNMGDTLECLESLARVDYPRLAVILVNNGSPDFDEARVRRAFPEVLIVTSSDNHGVTAGNNLGVARALEIGADLVLLLNPDTVVRPDLIRSLLPALNEPGVGIVGPVITYYDAPDTVWFAGGRYSRLIAHPRQPEKDRPLASVPSKRAVDWVNSCALLAKREVFEVVGPFWEDLFMYFDELEFCLRATQAGYQCVMVGEPLVRHKVSASGGIRGTNRFSPDKAYYFGRNPFFLLRRHASGLWAIAGLLSQFGVVLPYWALRCALAKNTKAIGAYLAGMRDGIAGRSGRRPVAGKP
ncbi:MAG: glycosyltransferase family 2 protein [Chloroflexi bacterium]|nr:glycosyltransferase family 2 protein [Chloroflexota bacterium]MCL5025994.1 glycosyltransferase family 2 protein [Chloroflexota bacterium]